MLFNQNSRLLKMFCSLIAISPLPFIVFCLHFIMNNKQKLLFHNIQFPSTALTLTQTHWSISLKTFQMIYRSHTILQMMLVWTMLSSRINVTVIISIPLETNRDLRTSGTDPIRPFLAVCIAYQLPSLYLIWNALGALNF